MTGLSILFLSFYTMRCSCSLSIKLICKEASLNGLLLLAMNGVWTKDLDSVL